VNEGAVYISKSSTSSENHGTLWLFATYTSISLLFLFYISTEKTEEPTILLGNMFLPTHRHLEGNFFPK
jgi:hypothetical protein